MKHIWVVERKSINLGWVFLEAYKARSEARDAANWYKSAFKCRITKFIPSEQL